MFRTIFAAWLLRSLGASVEYRVQRMKPNKNTGERSTKDGTTVLRCVRYRDALAKFKAMRVADTDTVVIRISATIKQRHGQVA